LWRVCILASPSQRLISLTARVIGHYVLHVNHIGNAAAVTTTERISSSEPNAPGDVSAPPSPPV
jgi:hypothetical protein